MISFYAAFICSRRLISVFISRKHAYFIVACLKEELLEPGEVAVVLSVCSPAGNTQNMRALLRLPFAHGSQFPQV